MIYIAYLLPDIGFDYRVFSLPMTLSNYTALSNFGANRKTQHFTSYS